ncbi:hypothetical protein X770_00960 [Mesorhizobium sp. LSJC269B00]|nr:hypothetical protein X770_00960 [Mesorhizobium sp. LSJC269B00]
MFSESVISGRMDFAFFLGAGCSISSGILPASTLCLRWIRELKRNETGNSLDFEEWYEKAKSNPGFSRKNAGAFYAKVIQERFPNPALRRMAVQDLVAQRDPAFGYYVLSALMANEALGSRFNVVFTTNFDDLVADATFLFQHVKSLVIPHEDLASHAAASARRPLVVKVHGDANLSPLNTREETNALSLNMADAMRRKLDDRGLIFMGYSGFDRSVTRALRHLPASSLPNGVYWVNKHLPEDEEFRTWLAERRATWVQHTDFDEAMTLLHASFRLDEPNARRFKVIQENLEDESERLRRKMGRKVRGTTEDRAGVEKRLKSEMKVFQKAAGNADDVKRLIEEKLSTYRGNADLLGVCAQYMRRHDLRQFAEQLYGMALEVDPDHPSVLCAFAAFHLDEASQSERQPEVYEKVERLLRRACNSNPSNAQCLGIMASFQSNHLLNNAKADSFYERALQADPINAETLGSYANFLWRVKGAFAEALEYYERSMDINPTRFRTLANFSQMLFLTKDRRRAHQYASSVVASSENPVLRLEALFYLFAHHPRNFQGDWVAMLRALIDQGVRSPRWDFSPTLRCAAELQHPHILLLEALSNVIAHSAPADVLAQFELWNTPHGALVDPPGVEPETSRLTRLLYPVELRAQGGLQQVATSTSSVDPGPLGLDSSADTESAKPAK